jgi:hypothetical protein
MQLGVVIVFIPVVIYLFSTAETTTAIGFLIWALLIAPVDNVLKPIFLGRGVDVPMLVNLCGRNRRFSQLGDYRPLPRRRRLGSRLQAIPYMAKAGGLDC